VRIAVVSAWEPWRVTDGAAFILAHQLRHLAVRHEITVVSAGAPSAAAAPPAAAVELLPGVELRWFGTDAPASADFARRTARAWRTGEPAHVGYVERRGLLAALDELLAGGVDLLHLHGWGTAQLAARAPDVPAVHMAIDPWTANLRNRRLPLPRRLAGFGDVNRARNHERRHYPGLAAVVVVSDRDAELLHALTPTANVVVVGNGVDAGPAPVPIPAVARVLGFHGVFDSQANVDAARHLVHDIWPLVRQRVSDARVRLIGRRPPREVRELVGAGVELHSDVADVRAELEQVAVHVDWMTSGAGIKNKVLEAMAAARPVVTSPAGAAGIGPGPGLIVAPDVSAAAAAIADLLDDPRGMAELGAAGRRRVVEDFSWAASATALESVWERVVAARTRS
jgi:glycosyltransferase involved in cell wall biosynthesis